MSKPVYIHVKTYHFLIYLNYCANHYILIHQRGCIRQKKRTIQLIFWFHKHKPEHYKKDLTILVKKLYK